jgi:hypothetical protein
MQELFQKAGGRAELRQLASRQGSEVGGEIRDAALAPLLQKARACGGGLDVHAAGVAGIPSDFNQKAPLESSDNPAHGRWLNLLCGGKITERFRAGKDQDRQGRELRGTHARDRVLLADAAQQVDGDRMEAVGNRQRFGLGRDFFRLDFFQSV